MSRRADHRRSKKPRQKKVRVEEIERVEVDDDLPLDLYLLRPHTNALLRRYYYASLMVSRIACSLRDPTGRGWVSSRPVRSFEDAMIFVVDMEKCIERLNSIDQAMLTRMVKQDYTQEETALLMGCSTRKIAYTFPAAIDRLTQKLLDAGILITSQNEV
jgi:hypothetical protein